MSDKNLELAKLMVQEMTFCLSEYIEKKLEQDLEKDLNDSNTKIHMVRFDHPMNEKKLDKVRDLLLNLKSQHKLIDSVERRDHGGGDQIVDALKRLSHTDTGSNSLNKQLRAAVRHAEEFQRQQLDERDFSGQNKIDPL